MASTLTCHLVGDSPQVLPLLEKIKSDVSSVKADDAYDSNPLRQQLDDRGITYVFPPPSNAVLSKRHMVENAMFHYKNNIGGKLRSKITDRQAVEVSLGIHLLNQITKLGMLDSGRIN